MASLVAAVSFTLFPLGLLGGLVAAVLGGLALTRARTSGAARPGAVAGIMCGVLALAVGVAFGVHFGVFVARNTSAFITFDSCIAQAGNRSAIVSCSTHLASRIWPQPATAAPGGRPGHVRHRRLFRRPVPAVPGSAPSIQPRLRRDIMHPMFKELFIDTDADDLAAEDDRRRRVRRSRRARPATLIRPVARHRENRPRP